MGREERGVLDQVEDIVLFSMLQGKAPHVRADILKELILQVLPLGDIDKKDEQLSFLFNLYMESITEDMLAAEERETQGPYGGPGVVARALDRAQMYRAEAAKYIWTYLPSTFEAGGSLSLLRLAILSEVVYDMAMTRDENQADEHFAFLMKKDLFVGTSYEEFTKVLRASRKEYFPIERMNRFLRSLLARKKRVGVDPHTEALIDIFSYGIFRKTGHHLVEKYFRIMTPVSNGSEAIFNFLEEDVKKAGQLEAKAQSLIDAVSWTPQSPTEKERASRIDRSHLKLSFGDFETIILDSQQVGIPRGFALSNLSEKTLHLKFEGIKERILIWLSENPGMKVRFSMKLTQAFHDKPFFARGPVELK